MLTSASMRKMRPFAGLISGHDWRSANKTIKEEHMRIFLVTLILAVTFFFLPSFVLGGQDEFKIGFEEGYKSIKGEMALVPICPIAPITPIGSNDYREGIKAGMTAANQDQSSGFIGGSSNSSKNPQEDFEAGFIEGYKSIKGDMTIVPICPIAPICPIGSTNYREGLKAGMAAANMDSNSNSFQESSGIDNGIEDNFEAGFEAGFKSIKGDYSIVPICPIPPITPIGSTPYREGIKAGIKAAER